MDAKELAAKFVAKAAAAVAEKDRQETAKPDDDGKRLEEDVEDCKRAMTEVVIPFLSELKAHFPQDQFSFAPQIDLDHKFVGVLVVGFRKYEYIRATASSAYITRVAVNRLAANKGFGYFKSELTLADAIIACKQHRIRNTRIRNKSLQRGLDRFISDQPVEHT